MYFREHAETDPASAAIIRPATGEVSTYADLESGANRLAHLFRDLGLRRGGHIALLMENSLQFAEVIAAAARSGLYYTPVSSHLTAAEAAYIIADCAATVVITSESLLDVAAGAMPACPAVTHWFVTGVREAPGPFSSYDAAVEHASPQPLDREWLGQAMMYSSGTTGRPKGILRPLPDAAPAESDDAVRMGRGLMKFRPGMILLIPAPLYHAAPHAALAAALQLGATSVVMDRFDASQLLELIERYRVTHVQMVPTMFTRLLALPEPVRGRYDLSSLEAVVHSAAPCPIPLKDKMINWLGPIIYEYYGATESYGFTRCTTAEWLAHKGTVGRSVLGEILVLDDHGKRCATGEIGNIWFVDGSAFSYFGRSRTRTEAGAPAGGRTVGDVGYVDADGYLYLTDRKNFMIVSGGVNIYPQEIEDVLLAFEEIEDAAVIGVPDDDFGEQVKAVVVIKDGYAQTAGFAARVIQFCRLQLAGYKCPRTVDVVDTLPRLESGKLAKHIIRERYLAQARPVPASPVQLTTGSE